jgi:hypothetical protein
MSGLRSKVLAAGLVATAACAGRQVSTDYSPSIDFSRYRTFAMVSRPDSASHELVDDRVRAAVAAQLINKGLGETTRSAADLYVGYGVVDHTHTTVYRDNWGWGPAWGWRYYRWGVAWPVDSRREVETYTDGTVVVCLVDAATRRVVWEGQAADVLGLPVSNPERATKQVGQAVAKIFAKYPPTPSA